MKQKLLTILENRVSFYIIFLSSLCLSIYGCSLFWPGNYDFLTYQFVKSSIVSSIFILYFTPIVILCSFIYLSLITFQLPNQYTPKEDFVFGSSVNLSFMFLISFSFYLFFGFYDYDDKVAKSQEISNNYYKYIEEKLNPFNEFQEDFILSKISGRISEKNTFDFKNNVFFDSEKLYEKTFNFEMKNFILSAPTIDDAKKRHFILSTHNLSPFSNDLVAINEYFEK